MKEKENRSSLMRHCDRYTEQVCRKYCGDSLRNGTQTRFCVCVYVCMYRCTYMCACAPTWKRRWKFGLINYCQLLKRLVKIWHLVTHFFKIYFWLESSIIQLTCLIVYSSFLIDTSIHIVFTQMMPNLILQTEIVSCHQQDDIPMALKWQNQDTISFFFFFF